MDSKTTKKQFQVGMKEVQTKAEQVQLACVFSLILVPSEIFVTTLFPVALLFLQQY